MGCAKESTKEEMVSIMKSAAQYAQNAEEFAKEVVKNVSERNISSDDAKFATAIKYLAMPQTLKEIVQGIEEISSSGKSVDSVKYIPGQIATTTVEYSDGSKDVFSSYFDFERQDRISKMESVPSYNSRRDSIISDCVVNQSISHTQAKEALIATYIEGKSPKEWPMDKIKEAIERLEYERKAELRQEIGKTKEGESILDALDRSQPERSVETISEERIEKLQERYPGQVDQFGRRDYIPDNARDVVENESLKAGTADLPSGDNDRIIQLKDDPVVQSVHIHEHKDGVTISTLYKDGSRDNFDIHRGIQQKYNVTIVSEE